MRARQNFVNELARLLNSSDINLGTLLKCIQTFFAELDKAVKSICQTLGLEATEEIIEEIRNLFYLDPSKEDEQKLIQALENLRENLRQQLTPIHFEIFDYITLLLSSTNYKSTRKYFETELVRAEGVQEIEGLIGEMLDLADEILARSNDEQLKADIDALRNRYREIIDRATLKAYGEANGEMLMADFNARLAQAQKIRDIQAIQGIIN